MLVGQYNDTRVTDKSNSCQVGLSNPYEPNRVWLSCCLPCEFTGRNCRKCQSGFYGEVVKHPLEFSYISYKSQTVIRKKRAEKARVCLLNGMVVNDLMYGRGRIVSISEGVAGEGISKYKGLNRLLSALRRKYSKMVYAWVRHHPPSGKRYKDHRGQWRVSEGRFNLHLVLFNTGFIYPKWLGSECERALHSRASGLGLIWDYGSLAGYLAEYLAKDDFVKAGYSSDWLFPQWREFSKAYECQYGYQPPSEYLYRMKMLGRGILREQFKGLQEVGFFERRENDKHDGLYRRFKFNGESLSVGGRR